LFILGVVFAGCGGAEEVEKSDERKPASVTAPVKEADLTTITLSPEAEKRLAIMTLTVERKAVTRMRTVGGEIAAPSGSSLSITAPVAGTLQGGTSVPTAGAAVTRGQPLFRLVPIPPSERDAAVDAQQAVETAAARVAASALKVQRAERLVKDGAGSRRQLEEAQAEFSVAEAELKAANGRVMLAAQSRTSPTGVAIEAPQTAMVQAVHVRDGQTVAAGAPMLDLVRLDTVWVRVPVYAGESSDINTRAPAEVLTLGDPTDANGFLARPIPAPPSANATTAGVDLYYQMVNSGLRFRPGERVAVRLPRRASDEALVVPKAALLHDAFGGTWVYVQRQPQVYVRQRVVVQDMSGPLAVLSLGPEPGARVVTDGAAELFGVEFGAGK
jgi:RND family efflux transporter MFP subunit